MKHFLLTASLAFMAMLDHVSAQPPTQPKPPLGAPTDAKLFNGKWYHVYLEKGSWKRAREKCAQQGGQLAVIPDEPTQAYIKQLANGLQLWLGATDEKVEKLWVWVDGTPMKFTAWADGQPSNTDAVEHYLQTYSKAGRWNDGADKDRFVVGFICEWKVTP